MERKLVIFTVPFSPVLSVIRDGCKLSNVDFVILNYLQGFAHKILFNIFIALSFNNLALALITDKANRAKLKTLRKQENISFLFWGSDFSKYWLIINKLFPVKSKNCFSWGPIEESHNLNRKRQAIKKIRDQGVIFYTMNPYDEQKYSMILTTQVHRRYWAPLPKNVTCDFFFLGKTKGREKILTLCNNQLKEKGFNVDFRLYDDLPKQFVPFNEYINLSMQSKCLVDVVSPKFNQTGLTLRPLEALFFKKKLLTTCQEIKTYDFYHPDNIFIIDNENPNFEKIEDFMKKPFHEIDESIVAKYDVNNWLKKYFL